MLQRIVAEDHIFRIKTSNRAWILYNYMHSLCFTIVQESHSNLPYLVYHDEYYNTRNLVINSTPTDLISDRRSRAAQGDDPCLGWLGGVGRGIHGMRGVPCSIGQDLMAAFELGTVSNGK